MLRRWTALLVLFALFFAQMGTSRAARTSDATSVQAQAAASNPGSAKFLTDRDQPDAPSVAPSGISIESYGSGDSIADSDEEFVADSYWSLDRYTFRSGSPIRFPIRITRYFGPVDGEGHLLHPENIEGQQALLTLRVWDVDQYYPGPEAPEVDEVRINGIPVGTLAGANGQWSTFTVQVPVSQLKFPTYSDSSGTQPVDNWVEVYIDTANVGVCECWAVQVDWGRLVIKGIRPAVLVHGFMSNAETWAAWKDNYAPNAGLPVWAFSFDNNHDSWLTHAQQEAGKIAEAKQKFGVQKLNIVGHSKGGLDSRAYLAMGGQDVDRLVMLGTPNGGSPLADIVVAGGILNKWIGLVSLIGEPALTELTVTYMKLVGNRIVGPNPNTAYYTVAGNYTWHGISNPLIWGADDGVVAVSSVNALPYTTFLGETQSFHTSLTSGSREWQLASSQVVTTAEVVPQGHKLALAGNFLGEGSPIALSDLTGQTVTGGAQTSTVQVAAGAPVTLGVLWGKGNLNLTLTSPSGQLITGATTGVELVQSVDPAVGISYAFYRIAAPEAGAYQLQVTADPTATINYLTVGATEDGLQLTAAPDNGFVQAGQTAVIRAALSGPVAGAVGMQAHIQRPDGQVDVIALADSGSGNWSGSYTVPADGFYQAVVVAENEAGFRRIAVTGFQGLSRADRFTGSISHKGVDTSGDGLYDFLSVQVGVATAMAGDYLVTGTLTDATGRTLVRTANQIRLPAAADTPVTLAFDGKALGDSGFTGDLILTDLALVRADGAIADFRSPAATLRGYSYGQFQRQPVAILPGISDRTVDTNGDGQYEQLVVAIPVSVLYAGYYDLNARLMDSQNAEIEWASNTVYLPAGQSVVTLTFSGTTIGKHGVDGPYYVRDFSMYDRYAYRRGVSIYQFYTTAAYEVEQFQGYEQTSFASLLARIERYAQQGLIEHGVANSLSQKVENAQASAGRGQARAARNTLEAALNELSAQSGQQVDAQAATELTREIQVLINRLQ